MPEVMVRNLRVGDKWVSIRLTRDWSGGRHHEVIEGGDGLRIHRPEQQAGGRGRFSVEGISPALAPAG